MSTTVPVASCTAHGGAEFVLNAYAHAYMEQHHGWQPIGLSNDGDSEHLLVKFQSSLAQTCHLLAEVNCLTKKQSLFVPARRCQGTRITSHRNDGPQVGGLKPASRLLQKSFGIALKLCSVELRVL